MIEESEFLGKFEGVQQSGGGWIARCPSHGDDNPSLSIARGEDGRWLVHCHAGCTAEQVVEAVGLKMRDLMPDSPSAARPSGQKKKWRKWVCDYIYEDEDGTALYKVGRYVCGETGKKDFLHLHPDPESRYGWTFGIHDKKTKRLLIKYRCPFHLPRLLAASKAGKTVVVLEGEKDVLSFEEATGCAATCNSGGALKWGVDWPDDWIRWFHGAGGIIIVADNDPKTKKDPKTGEEKPHWRGQKHAWDVRRQLVAAGFEGKIKLMVMPPVGGEHPKDFTDWLEARRSAGLPSDRAAFMEAVKNAAPWPKEWEFGEEALLAAAKDGHADASTDVAGGEGRASGRRNSIATVSRACPNNELPKGVPVRIKAWSAALWLLMRGSFFWHSDNEKDFSYAMFLDRDKDECRLMRVMSNEFFAFVGAAARLEDIDPKKGDMAKILGLVKQIAVDPEYSSGVKPGNSWERQGDAVYISNGDTAMCRVKDGKCEMVQNGTDGVVFLRGNTLAPWKLVDGDGMDPFAEAPIFKDASWTDESGPMNMRLWVVNLFAQHRTKPILLITGKAQSGKTRMACAVKEILGVRRRGKADKAPLDVEEDDKGREAFWIAINNGKVEIFDNLDTKIKWVSNAFQNAATGGQMKRRQLYSDDGESIYDANASIILTSNNPLFSTEGDGGMADRIITLNLASRSWSAEDSIDADIAAHRDDYLTWMARTLAKALQDKEPVDASMNRRHPAYGEFSVRIGRAIGNEAGVVKALGAAEANKAILPLLNDPVAKGILEVLKSKSWEWEGTAGELSELIVARQGDDEDEKTKSIYSSRRVGKALNRYLRQFSLVFRMDEPKLSTGRTHYVFRGISAMGVAAVGLVGLDGDFPQSACASAENNSSEINPPNPPNPPDAHTGTTWGAGASARARAPSPLPSEEEEGVEGNTEDFEWDI